MRTLLTLIIFSLTLGAGITLAVNDIEIVPETTDLTDAAVALDEDVSAQDLGVGEPNILPDSPLYFFKEWGRNIQSFFTFDPVKKAELKEKFTSEKLIEVKTMVEQNKVQERIEMAIENYRNELGEMVGATERIREKAEENEEVGKFLDKFIQQRILQDRLLQKLEEQVPAEVFKKIKEAREIHIEKFGEVMTKLEDKAKIQQRLEKNLQEVKGSEFKDFKNLEILQKLEEEVPEEAKEAVRNASENTLLRLKEGLEKLPLQAQEKFNEYIEEIGGEKEIQMEVIEKLKEELKELPTLQQNLIQTKERVLEGIKVWTQEQTQEQEQEQTSACIQVWKPVCGKDGKTYSNECFAESAGVEIDYESACRAQKQLQQ